MAARSPREARFLGLWTAGWLAVLLVVGLLWVGDLSLQWPVLLVPVVWALIAVRPRRRSRARRRIPAWSDEPPAPDEPPAWEEPPRSDRPGARRPPPTQEQPWLPEVPPSGARRDE